MTRWVKQSRISVVISIFLLLLAANAGYAQEEEKPLYARGAVNWKKVDGPFFETCSMCHQRLGERLSEQVLEWRSSIHYQNGVFCDSCHGGDPTSFVLPISMGEENGFKSDPSPQETPDFCGPSCHPDAFTINEANIHTEDFEDNEWEPHCVTCHGSHEVQAVNTDLITLEEKTCGPCHTRTFYLRQTEKDALVAANYLVEELYTQLESLPNSNPIKNTARIRLDKASKDLRKLAHYFNRRQIVAAKEPIDKELAYIQSIIQFDDARVRR